MKKNILVILFCIGLSSCHNEFVQPQPIDAKILSEIPEKLTGTYREKNNPSILTRVVISKNRIQYFEENEKTISKDFCFVENKRYYTVLDQKKTEMYNPVFLKDSVTFLYAHPLEYVIGSNLVLKDLDNSLVFNVKTIEDAGWTPAQVIIKDDIATSYLIKDEITDKLQNKAADNISKNLESMDFDYYQKRKDQFLELYITFDLKNKLFWGLSR